MEKMERDGGEVRRMTRGGREREVEQLGEVRKKKERGRKEKKERLVPRRTWGRWKSPRTPRSRPLIVAR